jgi:hyperosmotically inducible periplasmic protein
MRSRFIPAACVAVGVTIACSQTDAGVTTSVKARFASDETLKARNINVETKDHIVTLTGEVQSEQEQSRALEIARQTNGVVDVVDNITIAGEPQAAPTSGRVGETGAETGGRVVLDPGITADVKARLLADSTVKGLKIDVDTQERVVTLKGTVDTQTQKDHALEIARSVDNVSRVEDKLAVRDPSR